MGHAARLNARSFQRPRGAVDVKDAFGRSLKVGDIVIMPTTGQATYRVSEIAPELDPRAGNNMVRVTLMAEFSRHVQTGGQLPLILVVPQEDQSEVAGSEPEKVTLD
jgi:hypothetical protein